MKTKFAGLNHAEEELPDGGMVLVLDTGTVIGAESEAMLQALHSRSVGGIKSHLEVLAEKGADRFMENFYVGYGHKSIGDCGTVTIFIEGVSMLVAKAIQDWPLYSGQESSTRYVDYAKQKFIDPVGTKASKKILEDWRMFYLKAQGPVRKHLKAQNPIQEGEKETIYEKAINARSFDILRAFLPSGASTNLAWHTNLRQAADKIMLMRHHPLKEVQEVALAIEEALQKAFPSSFGHKRYDETEKYNADWMGKLNYFHDPKCPEFEMTSEKIDRSLLAQYRQALKKRPPKTELPKQMAECGTVQFSFLLDFGSFRDIQRHRALTQRMPRVTPSLGFSQWYLDELPDDLRTEAKKLIASQKKAVKALKCDKDVAQYYYPMGYQISNRITGTLPALVYLVELRATRFVHPTLAHRARQVADVLQNTFGNLGLVLHLDPEPNRFDVRRGEHDIVLKK